MNLPNYDKMPFSFLPIVAEWDGIDYADLLSRLTGEDYDICLRAVDSEQFELFEQLGLIWEKLNSEHCPRQIKISSKWINVPQELRFESFGKKMSVYNLQRVINDSDKIELELLRQIPVACAIYLCDRYYSEFRSDKIGELSELIAALPAKKIYALGMFFFRKLQSYNNKKGSGSVLKSDLEQLEAERLKDYSTSSEAVGLSDLVT